MIQVKITKNSIEIKGHSDYAPIGQDIVCASVSTMIQFLINISQSEFVQSEAYYLIDLTGIHQEALEVFKMMIRALEKEYPCYLSVILGEEYGGS